MHVLYVHQNYPAQFGHIARHLVQTGRQCTFVTRAVKERPDERIPLIRYRPEGHATQEGHYCARSFENTVWHCDSVYRALKRRPDVKPDLIVGHSGFGTTLFLPELYPDVPVINYFEYYFKPHDPSRDWDFRQDLKGMGWEVPQIKYLRARCRNAMILLDLQNCDVAYAPTQYQRSVFPSEYQGKMQTVFDGVDRSIYHGYEDRFRRPLRRAIRLGNRSIPAGTRIVTYVSRGFESMRGFDLFMRAAKRIYQEYPNVVFVVVGRDKVEYGFDNSCLDDGQTFRDWVLAQEEYDLSKFIFVGKIRPAGLGRVLAASDLHIYLTVPYILSWSMMDAMSCGAVVLGSATPPVMEMIHDGVNGLLVDFFDPDAIAAKAIAVLRDPAAYRALGKAAEQTVVEMYSLQAVIPQMLRTYEAAANKAATMPAIPSPAIPSPAITTPVITAPAITAPTMSASSITAQSPTRPHAGLPALAVTNQRSPA